MPSMRGQRRTEKAARASYDLASVVTEVRKAYLEHPDIVAAWASRYLGVNLRPTPPISVHR